MWPSIVGILAIVGAVVGVKHWMGNNEYKSGAKPSANVKRTKSSRSKRRWRALAHRRRYFVHCSLYASRGAYFVCASTCLTKRSIALPRKSWVPWLRTPSM